ncbi:MAG TPA: NAD(P)-dependent alcohol dehydrogenase [Micromonosporaceae bacterium]
MRAAVVTAYGAPDVVSIVDVPTPVLSGGDVLVRVHATTVNRTDSGWRGGKPFLVRFVVGFRRPRNPVLGGEFAGVVEAVGDGVTSFAVGDRVFGYAGFGAHAEYLTIRANGRIATIPPNMSFEQAAASTEGAQYALSFLETAKVRPGQWVLVYGATGAIGSAAVQFLKASGVNVTAVCATPHLGMVKRLGADRVVDYTTSDFTKDEQVYDSVFDAVGKTTFGRCRRLLKRRGTFISPDFGPWGQNPLLIMTTPLLGGKRVKFPMQRTSGHDMVAYMQRLMAAGQFRPVIDRTYPLDQIVDAYRYVDTGQKIGNVVITVVPAT